MEKKMFVVHFTGNGREGAYIVLAKDETEAKLMVLEKTGRWGDLIMVNPLDKDVVKLDWFDGQF